MNTRTALYRHYNSAGELLYVGISASALARLAQHNHHSGWVSESVRMETEYFKDRLSALIAEKQAIKTEKPKFNIKHAFEESINSAYPNASYSLTLIEIRFILIAITKMDFDEQPVNTEVTVSNYDYKKFGFKNNKIDLKAVSNGLSTRTIKLDFTVSDTETNWVDRIDYISGEGKVILNFAPKIIPYLSQLSREFTQYKLENVSHFESMYSFRLYELLMQWINTAGKREMELNWLKNQLQLDDKYQRITFLKLRVIDVAVREINQHSNITVSYTQRKKGRVITHFIFSFALKKPEKPKLTQKYILDNARPGESWTDAAKRLSANLQTGLQPPSG